jgi:hypothetical protein
MTEKVDSVRMRRVAGALLAIAALALPSTRASAQGCEPIRFTVPISLGAEGQAYQPRHEWKATLAYRRLVSNQWFVGTKRSDELAPGGSAPVFAIHTGVFDLAYGVSDRMTVRVSVPFSKGSFTRTWPDGQQHTQRATGIGDISVQGEAWLLEPRTHESGNVSIGLGLKMPTGSHSQSSQFYMASGAVEFPADQTIQPGDGGFAILTQLQAFRQVTERTSLYAFGSYMISPKKETDVAFTPAPGALHWSVPDVYSVRTGVAFDVLPDHGISASLGARLDGIPVRDLIGGGDDSTIKRTSRILFAEPGVAYTRGRDNFTISVPWRLKVNRLKSLAEQQPGGTLNAGGFAKYLVFASYSRRL